MTSPQRIRVLTPEALDAAAANLVNTANTKLRTAVSQYAGTVTQNGTAGVSAATPNAIIARDANARAQVASPSASADIATKGYVDTTVGGYIPTAQLAASNGVATLGSTGVLISTQLPTNVERYLGSGTAWPSGARAGDRFTHTGVGCMFTYDGSNWWQSTPCWVNSRAARDALLTNYGAMLNSGFVVRQTDKGYLWRKVAGTWTYAGWAPDTGSTVNGDMVTPYPVQGDVYGRYADSSPSIKLSAVNQSIGNNSAFTVPWVVEVIDSTHGASREWFDLSTPTTPKLLDRCLVDIQAYAFSDVPATGLSQLTLNNPGGSYVMPTASVQSESQRGSGYGGSGTLLQPISWRGYVNPGDTFQLVANQSNTNGGPVIYHFYANVSISPA